jgi:hypothetical protein
MAAVKTVDDVLGRVCFWCGRPMLRLPSVKVAISSLRLKIL